MKPADRHEAASKQLEAAKAQKRAELRARLEDAGWSSVTVKAVGGFTSIGATDPQGNARSGCRADGEALVDDLLALGIPTERKRKDESGPDGADDGLRLDSGDPGSGDTGSDDHLGYDLDAELNEAIEDHPELFSQPDPEKEALRARIAELEAREPEIRTVEVEKIVERVVEVPVAAVVEEAGEGEPMPDALRDSLARLVTPSASETAKKHALMTRWINLKAQMEDMKLPERDRILPPISTAEIAEFEQLEAYMSWFR